MYAIGTAPLIQCLDGIASHQLWYMDDSAAAGDLTNLKLWWTKLQELGPKFGYYPNSAKTCLLVKHATLGQAKSAFMRTGLRIVCDGYEYLGGG